MNDTIINTRISSAEYSTLEKICRERGITCYECLRYLIYLYIYHETGQSFFGGGADEMLDKSIISHFDEIDDIIACKQHEGTDSLKSVVMFKTRTGKHATTPTMYKILPSGGMSCSTNKSVIMTELIKQIYPDLFTAYKDLQGPNAHDKLAYAFDANSELESNISSMFDEYANAEKHVAVGDTGAKPVRTRGGSMDLFERKEYERQDLSQFNDCETVEGD